MIPFRYVLTIFLSSSLLFLIQPLICKYILPWFGGTPTVWTTCLLFFQTVLLAGYAYAHLSIRYLAPRGQAVLHMALLLGSLAFLPVLPASSWKPSGDESPIGRILGLLAVQAGAPFLLLSATSPLLQAWFARTHPRTSPYRLYALSNSGSLLGLLGYPFLIEPYLALRSQGYVWSGLFALFALCGGWCALGAIRPSQAFVRLPSGPGEEGPAAPEPGGDSPAQAVPRPTRADRAWWLAWSACGSALLMSTTNQMSQDVAVVPFLWVLPLGLYLLTFMLCFRAEGGVWRPFWTLALPPAVGGGCVAMELGLGMSLPAQIAVYAAALFIGCMVCHGELAHGKPAPAHLTGFYLTVSAGGALGSCFVTLAAPALFRGLWEYPLALFACCALVTLARMREARASAANPGVLWAWRLLCGGIAVLCVVLLGHAYTRAQKSVALSRNFYGVLRVSLEPAESPELAGHTLWHGRIKHGFQFLAAQRRRQAASYYGPHSGIGVAERAFLQEGAAGPAAPGLRTGVVGLGAGTVAAYGRPVDYFRFYELNPEVLRFSQLYFSYCRETPAHVDVVLGDARVSLEREQARGEIQRFDILVLDAFSGDAIPLYLLTREAFALYWQHLKPEGVLALHITNRYLDLRPLARGLAAVAGKEAVLIDDHPEPQEHQDLSRWVLVTGNREFLDSPLVKTHAKPWPEDLPSPLVFTDDYSNLFSLLNR